MHVTATFCNKGNVRIRAHITRLNSTNFYPKVSNYRRQKVNSLCKEREEHPEMSPSRKRPVNEFQLPPFEF